MNKWISYIGGALVILTIVGMVAGLFGACVVCGATTPGIGMG